MARQKSIIKLKGKIGDMSFYFLDNEPVARRAGGFEGSRIRKEKRYELTRQNSNEFGACSGAGKLLRDALYMKLKAIADHLMVPRLTGVLADISKQDTVSPRGKRNLETALVSVAAKNMLKGFDFNSASPLSKILNVPYTVNTLTGLITLNNLVGARDLKFPEGTTHISFKGIWSCLHFTNKLADTSKTNTVTVPLNDTPVTIVLTPASLPSITGTDLFYLLVEFHQEVNGILYPLNNAKNTSLSIIEVV